MVGPESGHFRLESGSHTDSWLELDRLLTRPADVRPFAAMLAEKLARHDAEIMCGPMTGGAFLAHMVALELGSRFAYAERHVTDRDGMFPVDYRIGEDLRETLHARRVAVVDDAISAGSAVRSTIKDLEGCGASVIALGALMLIGDRPAALARERKLPLESLIVLSSSIWVPTECPMCALGAPLQSRG